MSHTPGPWTLRIGDGNNGAEGVGYIDAVDTHKPDVAVIYGDENRHADGKLIAAAPDLLDATKRLIMHIESEFGLSNGRIAISVRGDYEFATAAIAKAEGQ